MPAAAMTGNRPPAAEGDRVAQAGDAESGRIAGREKIRAAEAAVVELGETLPEIKARRIRQSRAGSGW